MATKNYFSGCEGKQHFEAVVKSGAEHALCSYLYVRKAGVDLLKDRKKKFPHMQFMVDSGAHTLIESYHQKFKSWKVKDFEDYCIAYRDWLLQNLDYIDVAVELDIDYCINMATGNQPDAPYGAKVVKEWQDKYFRPLEEKGLPIIYCWHEPRGMQGWEEMCSDFSYVGLPGEFSSNPDFNKYVTVAKRYTTRIHGFAATKQADFRDWPWYSIDSTSWKDSERYGVLLHWDEHKQRFLYDQDKTRRHLYRDAMLKYGLPADKIIAGKDYKSFTIFALISMTLMEKFYQRKYSTRVFYYELRLPHPKAISKMSNQAVNQFWDKCHGDEKFQMTASMKDKWEVCYWLSMVQYKQPGILTLPNAVVFFNKFFGGLLAANPNDIVGLQKALAEFISPPNPPPVPRSLPAHYVPSNNPPRQREEEPLTLEDYEWEIKV
jgi:hypothetical protein